MIHPLLVLKFGGTSLASTRRITTAARRIAAWRRRGVRVAAVVSATGHTTDRILARLAALRPDAPAARESDQAIATGERLSAALLAHTLIGLGIPARSLSGRAAGLHGRGAFGQGELSSLHPGPLTGLLANDIVPVTAGFQAGLPSGDTVTLGRGASDLTAVFLAARLGARECHIVTDVDGVYTADPAVDAAAARFDLVTLEALCELARNGARVMQLRAAELARDEKVPLRIYRWDAALRGAPGTVAVAP